MHVARNRTPAGHRGRGFKAYGHIGDDLLDKAEAVGEDTAAGAAIGGAIGTAFPVFGNAAGAAVGTVAGAVYGAIDNFGGDAVKFLGLNPPAFTEEKYEWERGQCRKSGGQPTPGVAPDAYGGCTYPDGTSVSGGDVPFPGTWNGNVVDADVYARAKAEVDRINTPTSPPPAPGPTLQRIDASASERIRNVLAAHQAATRAASLAHLQSVVSTIKVRPMGPTAAMVARTEKAAAPSKPVSTPVKVAAGVSGVGALAGIVWGVIKLLGR